MKAGEVQGDPLLICIIRESFRENVALEKVLKGLNTALSLTEPQLF